MESWNESIDKCSQVNDVTGGGTEVAAASVSSDSSGEEEKEEEEAEDGDEVKAEPETVTDADK